MMNNFNWGWGGDMWSVGSAVGIPSFLLILMAWSLFWKGLALWHSARRKEPWWFVAILLLNTAGILEIVYLFLIAKMRINELFSMREKHHTTI